MTDREDAIRKSIRQLKEQHCLITAALQSQQTELARLLSERIIIGWEVEVSDPWDFRKFDTFKDALGFAKSKMDDTYDRTGEGFYYVSKGKPSFSVFPRFDKDNSTAEDRLLVSSHIGKIGIEGDESDE